MVNINDRHIRLEVLIATMNRNSLDFLTEMFQYNDISKCHILIINQTTKEYILNSSQSNIRVVNSFEKGLSNSRNLALQNTNAKYALIADDDVVFEKDFQNIILEAFDTYSQATLITFKAKDFNGNTYRNYLPNSQRHNLKSIKGVISWEIAINITKLQSKFDTLFGLGAEFETSEEYLFARDIVLKQQEAYFYNMFIVGHPVFNSGKDLGSNKIVYARAALNYKLYGNKVYAWIFKYLFFLVRNKYIHFKEISSKFKIAIHGIQKYKALIKRL